MVPTQPTGRIVVLALVAAALAACTGEAESATGPTRTGATSGTGATAPTGSISAPPGTAVYTYANQGLQATLRLEGGEGTLEVVNGTEHDLGAPDLYALDALDGRRMDGEVQGASEVAAGATSTFDVAFEEGDPDGFGLVLLLFGSDNYGAFVRRA